MSADIHPHRRTVITRLSRILLVEGQWFNGMLHPKPGSNMKLLKIAILILASCFGVQAANPSYQNFKAIGGITITSNPPNGDITFDGSAISAGVTPAYV